jgi:hypothetical protein
MMAILWRLHRRNLHGAIQAMDGHHVGVRKAIAVQVEAMPIQCEFLGCQDLNLAILSASLRHSGESLNPVGLAAILDSGFRRNDFIGLLQEAQKQA